MKWKIINVLSCLVLLFVLALFVHIAYLMFFDTSHPIELLNLPFPTDKQNYYPGESVYVFVNFEKHTYISPTITVSLQNGYTFTGPKFVVSLGGDNERGEVWSFSGITIPANTPPGRYHISGVAEYKVNKLRKVIVPIETERFNVLEKIELSNDCFELLKSIKGE